MKCSESISLIIKVLKSLFVQIIDGLNFGHICDRVSSTTIAEIFCVANKRFVWRKKQQKNKRTESTWISR